MGEFLLDSASGNNPLRVYPEYDFVEREVQERSDHRTLGGVRHDYMWHNHAEFLVPLRYVSSADASRINGWWRDRATVAFTLNSSESPTTWYCKIANKKKPFGQLTRPYSDLFEGGLILEATDAASAAPNP